MVEIKNDYKDELGNIYNIKNINFEKKEDMWGNLGIFVEETKKSINPFFSEDDNISNGVYIYQNQNDSKKALRIYKDWADYEYISHRDAKLLSCLQERQNRIKLTEFPTGIVTIGNSVIGQEIVFYEKYNTLLDKLENINNIKDIIIFYKKILLILNELTENNIFYIDLHPKNFMQNGSDIKLIDFENNSLVLDDSYGYKTMLMNLKEMLNSINKYLSIDYKFGNCQSLMEFEETIKILSKKI